MTKHEDISVTLSYTWTFNSKEWEDGKTFIENLYDIKEKANFNAIDVFHHLNQICRPDCKVSST